MATISTTTQSNPFQYPGQTLLVREPNSGTNGRYVCLVKASTADNYVMFKSTDKGATWAAMTTIVRTNLVDVGQIFMDTYDWLFWVYRTNESSQDRVYIRRIHAITGVSSGEVLLSNPGNGGSAGSVYSGLDIKTHYHSNGFHYIAVAAGYNSGGLVGVKMLGAQIDPSGNIIQANYSFSGTTQWLHAGTTGRVGVSMDLEHTGDGYSGNANLWVGYGRDKLKVQRIPWSGGGWTGSSGEATISSNVGTVNQQCLRWSLYRAYMVVPDPVNTDQVILYERNGSNSSTTTRRTPSHPTGNIRSCVMAYDDAENVRIWAVGTSTAVLYQIDYIRNTGLWSSWGSTGLASILGAGVDNFGAKRSNRGDVRWGLYTAASGAPNTLTYTPLQASYNPNTPNWLSPFSGAAADVAVALPISWSFSDMDPGDTQSAFAVSKQIGSGTLAYWRASDSTWQPAEVQNTSGTSSLTIPSSWAAATDAMHTFKVKVWDAANNPSAYSAGLMVLPSTPVNPTITSPTNAQVIGTTLVTVTWTVAEETQYRVQLNITSGALQYDSGWITGGDLTYVIPFALSDATNYTITLTTANNEGLSSANVVRNFSTSFVAPPTPTLALNAVSSGGFIGIQITNPAGSPAAQNQDLFRRTVGDTSTGIRVATLLAPGASYQDWKAVHGTNYEYRAIVTSTTGTTANSAWTS